MYSLRLVKAQFLNSSLYFLNYFYINVDRINTGLYRSKKLLHFKSKNKNNKKKMLSVIYCFLLLLYTVAFPCKIRYFSFCILCLLILVYIFHFSNVASTNVYSPVEERLQEAADCYSYLVFPKSFFSLTEYFKA